MVAAAPFAAADAQPNVLNSTGGASTTDVTQNAVAVAYECSTPDGAWSDTVEQTFDVTLPDSAETGQEFMAGLGFDVTYAYYQGEEPENVTMDFTFGLQGEAAPSDSVNVTMNRTGVDDNGEAQWDADGFPLTANNPGDLSVTNGEITITADDVVTNCAPSATEVLATTTVTGDPVEDDDDGDDETPPDDDETPPDDDETPPDDDETTPPEDDGDDDGDDENPPDDGGDDELPVTGAALAGLVAAAVAAVGGGGAAMYLSRRRKNAADTGAEE